MSKEKEYRDLLMAIAAHKLDWDADIDHWYIMRRIVAASRQVLEIEVQDSGVNGSPTGYEVKDFEKITEFGKFRVEK